MRGRNCITATLIACERVVKIDNEFFLNRYWDDRDTPRDESYAEDVATATLSNRPAREVYRHLRAGAESGWDFSSRWLSEPNQLQTIHTTDIVPIDLNSLLWAQEKEISRLCKLLGNKNCEIDYETQASKRAQAIRKYLWQQEEKRFADFDFRLGKNTGIVSAATLYPLFVGLAEKGEADAIALITQRSLVASGGLRTTQITNGQQWDNPNGWAPLQWIAVTGLVNYGKLDTAKTIAARWLKTVNETYRETGKLLEKYDIEQRRSGGGGEYPLQDGFGWTNGVTRGLIERFPDLDPDLKK
jgi:alpha,alpha-trehalase